MLPAAGFNTIKSSIVFFRIHILFAKDKILLEVFDCVSEGDDGVGGDGGDGGGGDDESSVSCIFRYKSCRAYATLLQDSSMRVSSSTMSVMSFHFKYSIHDFRYS